MSQRRTRAMGLSPSGLKSIDMAAPTRKPRKAKVSEDALAPSENAPRAKADPRPKRKAEATIVEPPPAKRTRHNTATIRRKAAAKPRSKAPAILPEASPEETSNSPEEPSFSSGSDETILVHNNYPQEPTPPTDTPTPPKNASPKQHANANIHGDMLFSPVLKQRAHLRAQARFAKFMETNEERRQNEAEKPLSECDDDEWAERLPAQLLSYGGVIATPKTPRPSPVKWASGALAMFAVRGEQGGKTATTTENEGKPCRAIVQLPQYRSATFSSVATSARSLTNALVIAAVSASIDWFENNPNAIPPTSAQMESLLDDFVDSQIAKATKPRDSPSSVHVADALRHSPTRNPNSNPQTPQRQVRREPLVQQQSLQSLAGHPQAPQLSPVQRDTALSWAAALSATAIRTVISTPVDWFTRRGITNQNPPATEPPPARALTMAELSAPFRQQRSTTRKSSKKQKSASGKYRPRHLDPPKMKPLAPASRTPTPAMRRGRNDSHLPVHLRGVLYEHLPEEWQAASQHMKVPDHVQDDPAQDEDAVDLVALYALAERNREKRWAEERKQRETTLLKQQASGEWDSEEYDQQQSVGSKRKVVTKLQPKVFSAKLGPSTFGLPLNIDDSSSEEEVEIEIEEEAAPRLRSCLRGSYSEVRLQSIPEEAENGDQSPSFSRPHKRPRTNNGATVTWTVNQGDEKYRARGSSFVTTPPQESTQLVDERNEFEQLHPFVAENPKEQANLDKLFEYSTRRQKDANIFREQQAESERVEAERSKRSTKLNFPEYENEGTNQPAILGHKTPIDSANHEGEGMDQPATSLDRPVLCETPLDRLNKQREKALMHKPKVPSGLHQTQIMSPIHDQLLYIGSTRLDPEVITALNAIPDSEIIAESFAHIPYRIDPIIAQVPAEVFEAMSEAP